MNISVEDFLLPNDEALIVNAICSAETETSGEIRVHIEATSGKDINTRTIEVFNALNMQQTQLRNGVLIYVAVNDKTFSIYGDNGINHVVPTNFWDTTKNLMQSFFVKGDFTNGLIQGILKAGQELKIHFPCQSNDINELPNTISKG